MASVTSRLPFLCHTPKTAYNQEKFMGLIMAVHIKFKKLTGAKLKSNKLRVKKL